MRLPTLGPAVIVVKELSFFSFFPFLLFVFTDDKMVSRNYTLNYVAKRMKISVTSDFYLHCELAFIVKP